MLQITAAKLVVKQAVMSPVCLRFGPQLGEVQLKKMARSPPRDTCKKKHELFRKRAGIEPVIGHCKSDHRLGRNFYRGLFGDSINVMLAAAAYNLKRAMRLLLRLFRWGS